MYQLEASNEILVGNDLLVFETACEQAIFYGNSILYLSDILPKLHDFSILDSEITLCMDNLCKLGYIKKKLSVLRQQEIIFVFSIENWAFKKYLTKYYINYESLNKTIKHHLKNEEIKNLHSNVISEKLRIPKMIVNHFLEEIYLQQMIKLTKRIRGNWFVEEIYNIK